MKTTDNNDSKHTPTPWTVGKEYVCTPTGQLICKTLPDVPDGVEVPEDYRNECEANAALIVRAVNNHEKLIYLLSSSYSCLVKGDDKSKRLAEEIAEVLKRMPE